MVNADSGPWLIDKSAYVRLLSSPDLDLWLNRINRGLVCITAVSLLEIGFSARSGGDWEQLIESPPISLMVREPMTLRAEERAVEVQSLLALRGHHRAVKVPDLMIAAVAEDRRLTLLHVDKDFDLIAEVTGQPVERLAGAF